MDHASSRFRVATADDIAKVLRLMATYYAEDGYPFSALDMREQLRTFVTHPEYGKLWIAEVDGNVVGYFAVTFGFSFEYGGRDAFLDELYLDVRYRGAGLGREAIALSEAYCREAGVHALHLEVEPHRSRATAMYVAAGFAETGRALMSKRL